MMSYVLYIYDTIFWSPDDSKINQTISGLKVGIKIDTVDADTITMSQPVLIETIIRTLGLENDSKRHQTPAVSLPLQKSENSEPFNKNWSYRSPIDMPTYLTRNN